MPLGFSKFIVNLRRLPLLAEALKASFVYSIMQVPRFS